MRLEEPDRHGLAVGDQAFIFAGGKCRRPRDPRGLVIQKRGPKDHQYLGSDEYAAGSMISKRYTEPVGSPVVQGSMRPGEPV